MCSIRYTETSQTTIPIPTSTHTGPKSCILDGILGTKYVFVRHDSIVTNCKVHIMDHMKLSQKVTNPSVCESRELDLH